MGCVHQADPSWVAKAFSRGGTFMHLSDFVNEAAINLLLRAVCSQSSSSLQGAERVEREAEG